MAPLDMSRARRVVARIVHALNKGHARTALNIASSVSMHTLREDDNDVACQQSIPHKSQHNK